jgi:hypothetical protein
MRTKQQYTIQELLTKNSSNRELQTLDWNRKISDVEWDISCLLGGDWKYNKKKQIIERIS